eukprot:CAMPEP_0113664284 /NCGR_PEP_ID=MMETSP0038_2-20120614/1642_1 /TAXON_ID=2898 /ORGANISM="Cryptomonas paramecium" /LENGTH=232 /DNA_ID=CAMNT_0000579465 /DNA_START=34 /DNA_END=729 /DNA_ORIENTATION=+ /assembly_acc=CAM_ASM_000170
MSSSESPYSRPLSLRIQSARTCRPLDKQPERIHSARSPLTSKQVFNENSKEFKSEALKLVKQIYLAKFIFGDSLEGCDDNYERDKCEDLHANDIPGLTADETAIVDDTRALKDRLKASEGVIRKLYARSVELADENKRLHLRLQNIQAKMRCPSEQSSSDPTERCEPPLTPDSDSALVTERERDPEASNSDILAVLLPSSADVSAQLADALRRESALKAQLDAHLQQARALD